MSAFGEKIREYRMSRGITQKALAEAANLAPTYFNRIEKGTRKRPKAETVVALIEALFLKPEGEEAKELVELAGYSPKILKLDEWRDKDVEDPELIEKRNIHKLRQGKTPNGVQPAPDQSTQIAPQAIPIFDSQLSTTDVDILLHRLEVAEKKLREANEELRRIRELVAKDI